MVKDNMSDNKTESRVSTSSPPPGAEPAAARKPVVLIIDDDEANREVLNLILRRENIEPILACNGKKGLESAHIQKPDVILLDVFMPEEDGFDILKLFKQNADLKDIPVVIFTILEKEDSRKKACDLGACGYITKPFDMKEVVVHIKKFL